MTHKICESELSIVVGLVNFIQILSLQITWLTYNVLYAGDSHCLGNLNDTNRVIIIVIIIIILIIDLLSNVSK